MKLKRREPRRATGSARRCSLGILGLFLAFFQLGLALTPAGKALAAPAAIDVKASSLRLDPNNPGRTRFGALLFVSGYELASRDSRFGGLSGMTLSDNGQILYIVSDRGYWFKAALEHDADGRLVGLGPWMVASLIANDGKVIKSRQRDAEALTRDGNGSFIVAFERSPRLWRYPSLPDPFIHVPQSMALPREIFRAPNNGGLEAATVLPDGRLFLLTEHFKNPDGSVKGWISTASGYDPVSYGIQDDFLPTDLATLPGGDLVLVERQYRVLRGAVVRLRRIRGGDVKAGARLRGEEMILLGPSLEVDNFEGAAVRHDPVRGTFIYLVSDDNYSPLQRTLLLQFRLLNVEP